MAKTTTASRAAGKTAPAKPAAAGKTITAETLAALLTSADVTIDAELRDRVAAALKPAPAAIEIIPPQGNYKTPMVSVTPPGGKRAKWVTPHVVRAILDNAELAAAACEECDAIRQRLTDAAS